MTPPGGGGGTGGYRDGNHIIQDPPRPGHLLQVHWEIPIGVGKLLDTGGPQYLEVTTEVVTSVKVVDQVGCGCPDLGKNLRGGASGGHAVRVGYMGDYTTHWEASGRIPPQVGP